jgi:hypothetical protein
MAVLNSTTYTNVYVNKYVADARDRGGRVVPLVSTHTVGSDTTSDTVQLFVIPAGHEVISLDVSFDACGGTCTMALGDSGSATRYMAATSTVSAGKFNGLLSAGMRYRTTADTIVFITWAGSNPTAAAVIKVAMMTVPGV